SPRCSTPLPIPGCAAKWRATPPNGRGRRRRRSRPGAETRSCPIEPLSRPGKNASTRRARRTRQGRNGGSMLPVALNAGILSQIAIVCLCQIPAAVDVEALAGDEAGAVGGEEHGGVRHLLRAGQAAERELGAGGEDF